MSQFSLQPARCSFYVSSLRGFSPMSGTQRTEGARQALTTQSLTHLVIRPAGERKGYRDQSFSLTSIFNMRLTDHTMSAEARNGTRQPHTVQASHFIETWSCLDLMIDGKESPATDMWREEYEWQSSCRCVVYNLEHKQRVELVVMLRSEWEACWTWHYTGSGVVTWPRCWYVFSPHTCTSM